MLRRASGSYGSLSSLAEAAAGSLDDDFQDDGTAEALEEEEEDEPAQPPAAAERKKGAAERRGGAMRPAGARQARVSGTATCGAGELTSLRAHPGVPWTEHEHGLFLVGLQKLGKVCARRRAAAASGRRDLFPHALTASAVACRPLLTRRRSGRRGRQGDWRGISRQFVHSRTPTQVASHAQKYFIRQTSASKRRRSSLFDLPAPPVRARRALQASGGATRREGPCARTGRPADG